MTIHVNIGEAKTRLSALVAAALRGEDVVLSRAGAPQVRLTPLAGAVDADHLRIARQREAAIGMYDGAAPDPDLSLRALKSDRTDHDERYRLKFADFD